MPPDPPPKHAVVLVSGGLDSATCLAIARHQGFTPHALSFDYGQRHRVELHAARAVAESQNVTEHRWIQIDLRSFGQSALTADLDVPKDRVILRSTTENGPLDSTDNDIPLTYVPARNTIFLSYALAFAEVIDAADIFIGVTAVDYSGYPDCRPQYLQAFQNMARLATKAGVQGAPITIHAPLIDLPKTEIIQRGLDLGVDYSLTHSCYDPDPAGQPCAHCDACLHRLNAFADLNLTDPAMPHQSLAQDRS